MKLKGNDLGNQNPMIKHCFNQENFGHKDAANIFLDPKLFGIQLFLPKNLAGQCFL